MSQTFPIRLGLNLQNVDDAFIMRDVKVGTFIFKLLTYITDPDQLKDLTNDDFELVDDVGTVLPLPFEVNEHTFFDLGVINRGKPVTKLKTRDWCFTDSNTLNLYVSYGFILEKQDDYKTVVAYMNQPKDLLFKIPNSDAVVYFDYNNKVKDFIDLRYNTCNGERINLKLHVKVKEGKNYYMPVHIDGPVTGRVVRHLPSIIKSSLSNLANVKDYSIGYM